LKEEGLDHTKWRARFGRGLGPFIRQTTKWMNDVLRWPTQWNWNVSLSSYRSPFTTVLLTGLIVQLVES
jgi:hypothetical protein